MYKIVVALVVLLLVLIYQSRTREAFQTDASGNVASSNITLTLADLLALFSLAKSTPTSTTTTPTTTGLNPMMTTMNPMMTTPMTTSTIDANQFYNTIRPSLLSDVSNIVGNKISGAPFVPAAPISSQSTGGASSCNSDSMAQGAEYVDAKANLEDNSDYIRKDSIPCYNCSL